MLGNEGSGLSPTQLAQCDALVYIAQHGGGTASLNVACAAAIVLHRFTEWAGYREAARDSENSAKFALAPKPALRAAVGRVTEAAEVVRARRAAARAETAGAVEGWTEAPGGEIRAVL